MERIEYLPGGRISQEEFPATDERDEIVQFIRASQRGIIKRFSKTNGDEGIVD
jgi:UDP-N-acetylglucosamine acyltransferase